jgi:hypothetical protein
MDIDEIIKIYTENVESDILYRVKPVGKSFLFLGIWLEAQALKV